MASPAREPQALGDYLLVEQLGEGGMAEVFRAQYIGRGSGPVGAVVVKRIRSELSSQPEFPIFRDMFLNEARLVRRLSHPNLARVFELLEADDPITGVRVPFIVGEYVQGRDLWTLMRTATAGFSGRGVPPALAAFIIREVAAGLGHAHAHVDEATGRSLPIIHRDVSPENVMISDDGSVKLIDFGVAKALGGFGPQTRTGIIKGKLAYMAPEQVAQRPVPATDVFGAGIVLYEMLTGRRLFGGPNEFMVVQRVLKARIPPPGTRVPVPGVLDEVTMRALERDLARRYRDGDTLAVALTAAMRLPQLQGADARTLTRWMQEIGVAQVPLPAVAEQGSDLHVDIGDIVAEVEGEGEAVVDAAGELFSSIDGPVDPGVHAAVTQAMRTLGPFLTPDGHPRAPAHPAGKAIAAAAEAPPGRGRLDAEAPYLAPPGRGRLDAEAPYLAPGVQVPARLSPAPGVQVNPPVRVSLTPEGRVGRSSQVPEGRAGDLMPLVRDDYSGEEPTHLMGGGPTAQDVRRAAKSGEPPRRNARSGEGPRGPQVGHTSAPVLPGVVASAPPPTLQSAAWVASAATVPQPSGLTPAQPPAKRSPAPAPRGTGAPNPLLQSGGGMPALSHEGLMMMPGTPAEVPTAQSGPFRSSHHSSLAGMQVPAQVASLAQAPPYASGPQHTVAMAQIPLPGQVPGWAMLLIGLLTLTVVLLLIVVIRLMG